MSPLLFARCSTLAAVVLAAATPAAAQMHQICYQGPDFKAAPTVVAGCATDGGGSCSVASISSGLNIGQPGSGYTFPVSPGSFQFYRVGAGTQVTIKFSFTGVPGQGPATRECTVFVAALGGAASSGAHLVGFSTDESGLVTTGVWRAHFTGPGVDIGLPGDMVAISGGVETAKDAFAKHFRQSPIATNGSIWSTASYTDSLGLPSDTVSYAIGLKIEGLHPRDLLALIGTTDASSPGTTTRTPEAMPRAQATLGLLEDRVALGGEFRAEADRSNSFNSHGQYASVSAPKMGVQFLRCLLVNTPCPPAQARGWRVESKDDVGSHPGYSSALLRHLPTSITLKGTVWEVRGKVVRSGSPLATEPTAQATGLRGSHALTGVGGEVQWRAFNSQPLLASNRLVQLLPQPQQGGAAAASRHGSVVTPATVEAWALGIKLVPLGTPPELEEGPVLAIKEGVFLPWLCQAFEGLDKWRGCEEPKVLRPDQICHAYPELRDGELCFPK
jgi:hypothetical protein